MINRESGQPRLGARLASHWHPEATQSSDHGRLALAEAENRGRVPTLALATGSHSGTASGPEARWGERVAHWRWQPEAVPGICWPAGGRGCHWPRTH